MRACIPPLEMRCRGMDTFPDRLRAARQAAGATQKQWAALAGVDQSGYSLWETGTCRPLAENLGRLAEAAHLCLACLVIGPQHSRPHHLTGVSAKCQHDWKNLGSSTARCSRCGYLLMRVHPANMIFLQEAAAKGSRKAAELLADMLPWPQ